MGSQNKTEYSVKKVGKGYRKFDGELYQFYAKATMRGSFADNGYKKHIQEVQDKANKLRKQGYQVRVVPNNKGEYLIYTKGKRTN